MLRETALYDEVMTFALKEETLVGDRGITLSGGQKWRLSLARALYSREKVRDRVGETM